MIHPSLYVFVAIVFSIGFICAGNNANDVAQKTLEEAHMLIERKLSNAQLKKIDSMEYDFELSMNDFGLGLWMRNNWGLRGDTTMAKHMRDLGFTHADDMSTVILETFWCRRHKQKFRIKERVHYYKSYWRENASPPKTARDPLDNSIINWTIALEAKGRQNRIIHAGKSKKTGRWVAFEHGIGVYVPSKKLLGRIKDADS